MSRGELNGPRVAFDAPALHFGRRGEIFGADEVRRGFLSPRNHSRGLREGRERLARETLKGLLGRFFVAVLEEELANHGGIDADRAVVAGSQPRGGVCRGEVSLGLTGVGHDGRHVQQLGDAFVSTGFGDYHPAVGVAEKDNGPVDRGDDVATRSDVVIEVAKRVAFFAATWQCHHSGINTKFEEWSLHLMPPPLGVANTRAMDENKSGH